MLGADLGEERVVPFVLGESVGLPRVLRALLKVLRLGDVDRLRGLLLLLATVGRGLLLLALALAVGGGAGGGALLLEGLGCSRSSSSTEVASFMIASAAFEFDI